MPVLVDMLTDIACLIYYLKHFYRAPTCTHCYSSHEYNFVCMRYVWEKGYSVSHIYAVNHSVPTIMPEKHLCRLNLDLTLPSKIKKESPSSTKKLLKSYLNLYKAETSFSRTSSRSELRDDSLKDNIPDNSTASSSSRVCSCRSVSILRMPFLHKLNSAAPCSITRNVKRVKFDRFRRHHCTRSMS